MWQIPHTSDSLFKDGTTTSVCKLKLSTEFTTRKHVFVYVNISLLNVGDSVGGTYVLILRKKDVTIRQS